MTDKTKELSSQIHKWMKDELKYAPVKGPTPTPSDFAKLCRGNMVPVWQFLITRMVTERTAKEIRGNLLLHQQTQKVKQQHDEVEDLLEQEAALAKELVELEDETRKALDELHFENQMYQQQESEEAIVVEQIDEMQERLSLLNALLKLAVFHCDLFQEYSKKLADHTAECERSTADHAMVFLQRRVAESVKEIATSLTAERVTAARHTDLPLVSDVALSKKFQENGTELLRCLTDLCDQRIAELAGDTSNATAAAQLQRQQETLNTLFDKLRTDHLERFAAVEEVTQRADEVESEWKQLWKVITADDKESFMVPLVRTLQMKELELKALEAMLENVNELAAHLSQMRSKKQKSHILASERMKQIQQLDAVISARRDLLKQLVQNNYAFRLTFKHHLDGIAKLTADLSPLQTELSDLHLRLRDVVSQESSSATAFPRNAVTEAFLQGKASEGKSLVTPEPVNELLKGGAFDSLRAALSISENESEVKMIPLLLNAKHTVDERHVTGALLRDALVSKAKTDTKMSQLMSLQELVRESSQQDAESLNSLVPLLLAQTEQTNKATEKCKTNTTRLLDEWWNQPAQYAAPWLLLDGLNMQQIVATVRAHFDALK